MNTVTERLKIYPNWSQNESAHIIYGLVLHASAVLCFVISGQVWIPICHDIFYCTLIVSNYYYSM